MFRRVVNEGIPLSSCVLGWDVDQWPGPVQEYTGHHTGWHDVRLVPDLGTLRPAAWLERTAICLADFVEMRSDELAPVAWAFARAGISADDAAVISLHGRPREGLLTRLKTSSTSTTAR